VQHSEWLKNVLVGKFGEGLLGCPFHDHTEEEIVGVAINPLVSGDVIQSSLTSDNLQNLIRRIEI
jgi:selenophosphate synthetase-related protein